MKNTQLSRSADEKGKALQPAVDRKRVPELCLGEWSGENALEIHPEGTTKIAAE